MTREELQAIKDKAARADEVLALIGRLEAAKGSNLSAVKDVCDWNTGAVLLPASEAIRALRIGIDTLIAQLEQELSDITVGEKPEQPKPEVSPFRKQLAENARGLADALEAVQPSWGPVHETARREAEIEELPEPLIAGGVHP